MRKNPPAQTGLKKGPCGTVTFFASVSEQYRLSYKIITGIATGTVEDQLAVQLTNSAQFRPCAARAVEFDLRSIAARQLQPCVLWTEIILSRNLGRKKRLTYI
jgi:hypothetical protein